ncbi:hypothetical protein P344_06705 [Spiroplasma mirum ATCC 29335]|uniref:Uncharacterized protein n=1 Tax=Spiroplasma mirum ATCC 29335 TaxID=838561 RepID=W6APJ3_9MOLU|nr:hypothetical protein P344_06705 [Spiroplasma mirum ATCC 29335]
MNKKIVKYHDSINEPSSILLEVKEFLKKYHVDKNDDFIG